MWSSVNKLMIGMTFCVCFAQMGYWYVRLPDPMPSHFDEAGQVDGQMGKTSFFVFMGIIQTVFLFGFPALGTLVKRLPDSVLNIPNKEYWLDPQRRAETLSVNVDVLSTIGLMTSWLLIAIFHLTVLVAIKLRETINPDFYWILGVYLV